MHLISKSNSHNIQSKGFTLIELIVVIAIIAILAAGASKFIANPLQSFIDIEARANLTDRADGALQVMKRQIRNALPNSLRVSTGANASTNNSFLEFIPIKQAGRYRASKGSGGSGNELDFSLSSDSFDVLGSTISVDAGDQLVIYNVGVTGSDVYETSPGNRFPITTTGSTLASLSFSGGPFLYASPNNRFYTISTPVSYVCDMSTKKLFMYSNYAIQATQPTSIATLNGLSGVRSNVLAENLTACAFNFDAGISERTGILNIMLSMTENGANVRLMHQVNINNSP